MYNILLFRKKFTNKIGIEKIYSAKERIKHEMKQQRN